MSKESQDRPRVARSAVFTFSVLSWIGLFGFIPWLIGRRGPNIGWRQGRPSILNLSGVGPLSLGVAGLGWCLASHFDPGEKVSVSLVPDTLIAKGPYLRSRNPMYVCEQTILSGWTILFGSPNLLFAQSALGAVMRFAVDREERTLGGRFGDSWQEYMEKVPRWL